MKETVFMAENFDLTTLDSSDTPEWIPALVEKIKQLAAESERLREQLAASEAREAKLQKELKTEQVLSFRNQVLRLEEQLAEIAAERNRVWWREHWTEYEYNIASAEREACIDCIKAFSTDGDRSEEMITAILRRWRGAKGEK